ncbi:thiol-disulfide oxidoreductase ResA [Psychrobacillus vulpis]|uniref:Thiol-disulfide oxidoreductase ResA n=1 Tax=Psychrobacillus vulpis TaxID=2325572 RepID=A0A544TUE1_9BACI|nr:thiol-disulfide oxidoreductase ResA [Psychrobacillus vulpis]TQR21072.1 thiol-disulfide oxidoreductase ResA [Psychrobacillus vulpis]
MAQTKKQRFYIRTVILVVLTIAIVFTVYSNLTKEKNAVLQVGDKAPDFVLVDMDGNEHRLSDYKGEGIFLNFWGTWCKPCATEMPAMDNQYGVYKDLGVQTLAINIGESDLKVNSFVNRYGLSFPVAIDRNKSVMELYNIDPLPTTFLINPDGRIEKIIKGQMTEQDIANYMDQVKPS